MNLRTLLRRRPRTLAHIHAQHTDVHVALDDNPPGQFFVYATDGTSRLEYILTGNPGDPGALIDERRLLFRA